MHITRLEIQDFRNYERLELDPSPSLTVLVGPNTAGKTNLIEAISIVTAGSSFRKPLWDDCVRWGCSRASLTMTARGEIPPVTTRLSLSLGSGREWVVDGVRKRRAVEVSRFVPAVLFTPDDLSLIKGPAEQRRSAIDGLGEQLSVTYGALRRDYVRVVRQKNAVLREEGDQRSIEPWDAQLIALGARLYVHRRRLLDRVTTEAARAYEHLSGGERLEVGLHDRCGVGERTGPEEVGARDVEACLAAELDRRRTEERARRVSLAGPHRDDIVFSIGGRDARSFGSQGQQRTVALAWKLAEVGVIAEVLRRTPVLLLDDVMSELDASRRDALTALIQQDIQTFVTTTNTGYFDPTLLASALVVPIGGPL